MSIFVAELGFVGQSEYLLMARSGVLVAVGITVGVLSDLKRQ